MTLAQLTYFVRTAETGHLTQTANEFVIAQPSLTQSIHKLEDELGFPLFEKSGRRLLLTREGNQFFVYAKAVVEAQEKARSAAERIYQANKGLVRFAHTEPVPKEFIPNLIHEFLSKKENQGVRLESDIAGTSKIYRELRGDEIDFGFCSKYAEEAEDLIMYPLFKRPIVLITSKNDPLAKIERVEPEDLARRPCVSYSPDSAMYHQIQKLWTELGIRPDVQYRCAGVAIGGLVARGLGWALVAMTDEIMDENIAVIHMPRLKLERTMYLAMRADRKHGPAAERFLHFVLDYSKRFQ